MFRKMRRFRQQLPQEDCIQILEKAPRGVLAVLGDEGYPYTVPLDFVYEDGKLYFHSAMEGHKIDAVNRCEKASFCVLDEGYRNPGEWWWYFNSVVAFGKVRVMDDRNEINEKLRLLGAKYFPTDEEIDREMAHSANRSAMIEFTIGHLTGKHIEEK